MPANLTPEYRKAEEEYRQADTPEEKLVCLKRMLQVIPKHKGTDHMQGELKQRIARLKETLDKRSKKKGPSYRVKPEGAGQIMIVGPPNSGKSSLLAALTRAEPEIADYPCTTREPVPGMLEYGGIQIQLVDLPPVWREHCESFVFDNIRACDAVLLVIDIAADDPTADFRETLAFLGEKHIVLDRELKRADQQGATRAIPCVPVLSKSDLDSDGELAALITELLSLPAPPRTVSATQSTGLRELAQDCFTILDVIRVYSKEPGKPPDMEAPYAIPRGATVTDFAATVHQDFVRNFRSARVWGSAKFDGQTVQRDYALQDGDVVELTMSSG